MSEERDAPGGTSPPGEDETVEDEYLEEEPDGEGHEPDPGEGEGGEEKTPDTAAEPTTPARTSRPGRRERDRAEMRELRDRIERQERELQGFRQQQAAPPRIDPQEQGRRDEQEFQAALANVPFEHQAVFAGRWWAERYQRQNQQQLQELRYSWAQDLDKSKWDTAALTSRRRQQFADRVEQLFQSEMRAGRATARENIYRYLVGDEVERQATRRDPAQRQAAARRVAQQRTQPAGARSDGARATTREPADDYQAALNRIRGQDIFNRF